MTSIDARRQAQDVGLVIPAFNEATRIEGTLRAALATSGASRILVVDDGSADATSQIARGVAGADSRFSLVRLEPNRGKAGAMVAGAEAAGTPIVAFLDADLIRLQAHHIEALLHPVLQDMADMTVGIFRNGRLATDLPHRFFPLLSGQRCLRWSRFAQIDGLAGFHSGVEIALSLHAALHGVRVQHVIWRGVTHALKPEKAGAWRGLYLYLKMGCEVAFTASRFLAHELLPRRR